MGRSADGIAVDGASIRPVVAIPGGVGPTGGLWAAGCGATVSSIAGLKEAAARSSSVGEDVAITRYCCAVPHLHETHLSAPSSERKHQG